MRIMLLNFAENFTSMGIYTKTVITNLLRICKCLAQEKLLYATAILETVCPIPTKFVKKLNSTDFYEMRVSTDNAIRVILFSADNENINLATRIIFLNGFTKKSTKDYTKEIDKQSGY